MSGLALRPCPFCGKAAEFERHGDRRQSCIVVCSECGGRHESGDTWNSGFSWNRRTEPGWQPIADLPEKPEGKVLLATARRVLGVFSGKKQIDGCDIWFIDDALYDGSSDPEFFLALPPLPR